MNTRLVPADPLSGIPEVTLTERGITIGRSRQNDVCLDDPSVSRVHARIRMLEGRYPEAEDDLAGALAILLAHASAESPQVAGTRADLGTLLRLMHKRDDAHAMLKQANDAFVKMSAPDRGQVVALAGLSETELDGGDAAAAQASGEASLALARKILPSGHFLIATPLFALARAELAARRFAEAEPLLREALSLRAIEPAGDPRVLEVKVALVDALEGQGRAAETRPLREEVEGPLRASRSPYAADLRARLAEAALPPEVKLGLR